MFSIIGVRVSVRVRIKVVSIDRVLIRVSLNTLSVFTPALITPS